MSKHNFKILTRKQSSNIEGQIPARKTVPINVCLRDGFPGTSSDRVCETCGKDHRFVPSFEGVKTSFEIIPLLRQLTFCSTQEKNSKK
jgi:hypothetical protein